MALPGVLLLFLTPLDALAADFTARLDLLPVEAAAIGAPAFTRTRAAHAAPFSDLQTFETNGRSFALLLSAPTGRVETLELFTNGTTSRGVLEIGNAGWRAAQLWRRSGATRVHFYAPRTGATLRYEISDSGLFVASSREEDQFPELVDKDVVSPYTRGADRRAFTLDSLNGDVAIHGVGPQSIEATASYSQGWSDVDHVEVGGATYRLLYKEVGHPYRPTSENSQAGRLTIIEVGADGLGVGTALDTNLGAGWSQVGFTQAGGNLAVYAYNRRNGEYRLFRFTGTAPSSAYTVVGGFIASDYDRLRAARIGGQDFLLGARFDEDVATKLVLDGEQAAKLAACVDEKLEQHVMGYQLAVIQNGRYLINRARGNKQYSPSPVALERNDRIDHGSVGKIFTAASAMKAADDGVIDLDGSLSGQVDPGAIYFTPWVVARTPRDLIAQTSGWDRNNGQPYVCEPVGETLTTNCQGMLTHAPETTCTGPNDIPNRTFDCPAGYYNANFGLLRKMLENNYQVSTTPEFFELTRQLWLDDVLPDGPSCRQQSTVKRFRYCHAGVPCLETKDHLFEQVEPGGSDDPNYWSKSCGAGGWRASARDVAQFVEQLRSEQILSPQSTEALFAVDWRDGAGNLTGHGWEAPYRARSGGALVVGKDGGTGLEKAYATTFEGHVSVSIVHNTGREAPNPESALLDAYKYAVGDTSSCSGKGVGAQVFSGSGGGAAEASPVFLPDRSAFVVALRNSSGNLQVKVYSHLTDGTLIERSQYIGGAASQISVAPVSGGQFMVGFENGQGNLELQLFSASSDLRSLTKQDEYTAGAVRSVKLVQLARAGAEVAVVAKTGSGHLAVIVFDRSGSTIVRRASYESSGTIQGADGAAEVGGGQIVVAARTEQGAARVIAFEVDSTGTILTRRVRSRDADEGAGRQVRITFVETSQGPRYVTAMANDDDKLELRAWNVSASGQQVQLQGTKRAGAVTAVGRVVSARDDVAFVGVLDGNGKVAVLPFALENGGTSMTQDGSWGASDEADVAGIDLAARPPYIYGSVMQVYLQDGNYKFLTWRYRPAE